MSTFVAISTSHSVEVTSNVILPVITNCFKLLNTWEGYSEEIKSELKQEILTAREALLSAYAQMDTVADPFHQYITSLYPEEYSWSTIEYPTDEEVIGVYESLKDLTFIEQIDAFVEMASSILG